MAANPGPIALILECRDVWAEITKYLKIKDKLRLIRTCRALRQIITISGQKFDVILSKHCIQNQYDDHIQLSPAIYIPEFDLEYKITINMCKDEQYDKNNFSFSIKCGKNYNMYFLVYKSKFKYIHVNVYRPGHKIFSLNDGVFYIKNKEICINSPYETINGEQINHLYKIILYMNHFPPNVVGETKIAGQIEAAFKHLQRYLVSLNLFFWPAKV